MGIIDQKWVRYFEEWFNFILFFSLDFFLDVTVSCFRETRYTPEQPHSNSYLYGEFQKISYEMSAVESVHHPVK